MTDWSPQNGCLSCSFHVTMECLVGHSCFSGVFQFFLGLFIVCLVDEIAVWLPMHASAVSFNPQGIPASSNSEIPDGNSRLQYKSLIQQRSTISNNSADQTDLNLSLNQDNGPRIVGIMLTISGRTDLSGRWKNLTTDFDNSLKTRSVTGAVVGKRRTASHHHALHLPLVRNFRRKLPDAIIIGVKKGGTRALLEFLKIHPDVRARGPETHFFDKNFHKGFDWYRRQMPVTTDGQITVEKTPSYFVTSEAPARIFRMSPRTLLIVVVRDPVTRAVSDYAQALAKRPDLPPFEQLAFPRRLGPADADATASDPSAADPAWGPVRIGFYARHVDGWLARFPRRQLHFVGGENLVRNPAEEMAKVERFLGLRPWIREEDFLMNTTKGFPCVRRIGGGGAAAATQPPRCLGEAKGREHPAIEPRVLRRLAEFFRPFNRRFYELTGIDFKWM